VILFICSNVFSVEFGKSTIITNANQGLVINKKLLIYFS